MRLNSWLVIVLIGAKMIFASSVDKQLKSNTEAMKKMEQSIKKAEQKAKELEIKESGVLQTITEIDKGLNQTREALHVLQKKENSLMLAIEDIENEMMILQKSIDTQKQAIAARVRNLYIHGKHKEWELLLNLLRENENPGRKLYWVQRLLENDKAAIEEYLASLDKQREKKEQLSAKQMELLTLHESKAKEEDKLQNQLLFQNEVLTKVKKDKSTQERAIAEYKKNQQALAALIETLEKKRRAEIEARRKAEQAKRAQTQKGKVAIPQEAPVAVGPKCTPLNGQIISSYGYHINEVLGLRMEHKGTEIRGQKGESVRAAAAGIVVMVGNIPGHGPSVILDHKGSYYSVYGHLESIKTKEGASVKNCQEIGTVGNAESANGYKLFFQIYKGTQTQDPMKWLKN